MWEMRRESNTRRCSKAEAYGARERRKPQRGKATIARLTEQAKRRETTGSSPVATTKIPGRKAWDTFFALLPFLPRGIKYP